jgi:hypothetical protein
MSTLTFIPKTHPSPPTSPYNNSSLALTLTLVPNTQSYPTHHRNANQRHPSHTSHNRHRAQSKGLNHTQPSTFLFFLPNPLRTCSVTTKKRFLPAFSSYSKMDRTRDADVLWYGDGNQITCSQFEGDDRPLM